MSQTEFYPILRDIISSYTFYKILQRHFNSIIETFVHGQAIYPPEFASVVIKFLGDEVTSEFNRNFKTVLSTAAADHVIQGHAELFSDEGYERSFRVSLERLPSLVTEMGDIIFKEKQNIGTVGAFLAFGATFAAYCEQKDGVGLPAVEAIVRSVAKHLDDNLRSWLKTNGGLSMLQSAKVECLNQVTASRKRKVLFTDSLKLVLEHCKWTANPQFFKEMCKLVLELQNLLGMKAKASETFFDYGMFLFAQGNYSGARDALENALKGFSTSKSSLTGQCHFQMGVVHYHMENVREALTSFQEALECNQIMVGQGNISTAISYHWLGYVYRRQQNIDKAFETQSRALKEMEKNTMDMTTGSFISDSCFELGCIYYEKGDLKNAVEFHQRSLLIREEHVAGFKCKLQSYLYLAKVLMSERIKRPCASNEYAKVTSEIVSLLDKALALCKEQFQRGNLHERFPVIMIAHTCRLTSIRDLLLLALELCENLSISNAAEENKDEKQKNENLKAEFKKLLRILDENELRQASHGESRDEVLDELQLGLADDKEHEQVAPPEINLRGRLALEAYNKALTEGKTCVKRVPVMLIGQDRSGKTSLKKSLKGNPFNPDEGSTVGVDVDPSYFQVTTEVWKAGEKDQVSNSGDTISYDHHAARLVVEHLKEDKRILEERAVASMQSENIPHVDTVAPSVNVISEFSEASSEESSASSHVLDEFSSDVKEAVQDETSENATESVQWSRVPDSDDGSDTVADPPQNNENVQPLASAKIPDEIETLVKKLLQEVDQKKEEDIYSVLWDFGGQSVYYVTHPLFLTSRAMYLLVYDLSRDLHERAKPAMKQGMFKQIEDSFDTKTNLEYLDFWMSSIASLASQDENHPVHSDSKSKVLPEKLPPVFLVCTHSDRPFDGADPFALAREIYGSLQIKAYKIQLYNDVFVVDNTKSGLESECSEVTRLRETVLAVAKELPQMKEVIPIKWMKYEKALQITREEGHKWISVERARQIASEVCKIEDKQEFVTLLNFLHDQRILIHFGDTAELKKLVVLDPQWLIDVFKKVITVKPYDYREKELTDLWQKLETTGILEETLLQHVWGPLLDQQETSESLIAIMEKFSLLCSWPSSDVSCSKQYLVPSMLMSHPPQDIFNLVTSAQIPSLFVKFESGQVPPGLFPRFILQFFQWGRDEFWSSVDPQLYQNFARFYTSGDEDCSVVLFCHSSSIEIVVHRANLSPELAEGLNTSVDAFDVFCARAVYRQLGLMLECMRKEFSWLRNMKYEVGVICSVCCQTGVVNYCRTHHKQCCQREECLHFWSESELRSGNQFIICTRSATALKNKVHVNQFAAWFASLIAKDERDGRLLPSGEANEDKSLSLPGEVVESLLSPSCDSKEVIRHLQLDQASLEHPGPGTKRLIRCLATKAKHSHRLDVVKHLREITPAGTTGPLLPGNLDIRNIPVRQMRELTIYLSGGEEWKYVAKRLGLTPNEIRYLDKRTMNPSDAALAFISQHCYINVEDLYDVLNDCQLPVIADLL